MRLQQLGFTLVATAGTAEVLARNGIQARVVNKVSDQQGETIVDLIRTNDVDIVINTPSGRTARADGYEIRAAAVAGDKPLFTSMAQVSAAVASLDVTRDGFEVRSLQEYQQDRDRALMAGSS
jgi:carbamoyl-phosphate synthase large subunit